MKKTREITIFNEKPGSTSECRLISDFILKHFRNNSIGKINILEAGCGQKWTLHLTGIEYEICGVDKSKDALEIRKYQENDLNEIIEGDLTTIEFQNSSFDLIYCSYVLEHIDGAEKVLDKFSKWLKPNGLLVLRIPDQETVYGFLSKVLPFSFHVFYKKYIFGKKNAGKPGYDPFPTFYDNVISKTGIRNYLQRKGLVIKVEHSYLLDTRELFKNFRLFGIPSFFYEMIGVLSFGKLDYDRVDIAYIVEKKG